MDSTHGGATEGGGRPHPEYQKFSDELQSARDSLERIKSNVAATTGAIAELNQTLRQLEQSRSNTNREVNRTVTRRIEPNQGDDLSQEPKRRGIRR